jgi:hypothetical protein
MKSKWQYVRYVPAALFACIFVVGCVELAKDRLAMAVWLSTFALGTALIFGGDDE